MNVIIYGAGGNCMPVLKRADNHNVLAIVDREPAKQGKTINGVEVVAPEKMGSYPYDAVVVSIIKNFNSVKAELIEKYGVPENKIIYFEKFNIMSPRNIGTFKFDWSKNCTPGGVYNELCSHASELSKIEQFFLTGKHNLAYKWLHYFEIYNRHFDKYFGKDITILEIGVFKGGSLQIWKEMFGPNARIIGVDVDPECKKYEDDRIQIFIGDQADRNFWADIRSKVPRPDILIDDGGHYMDQQIITFEEMFPYIKDDGVYLCEDIYTSYSAKIYNSGYKKDGTFVEYSKNFIDYLHAFFSTEDNFKKNEYTKTMHSLHYYYGALVVEKKIMYAPIDLEVLNTENENYSKLHLRGKI